MPRRSLRQALRSKRKTNWITVIPHYLVDALLAKHITVGAVPDDIGLTVNNVFDKHFYSGRVGIGAPRIWKLNASI